MPLWLKKEKGKWEQKRIEENCSMYKGKRKCKEIGC